MVLVEVDKVEAFRRMILRFLKNGKLISIPYMLGLGSKPSTVYAQIKDANPYVLTAAIDNSQALGQDRRLIEDPKQILQGLTAVLRLRRSGEAGRRGDEKVAGENRADARRPGGQEPSGSGQDAAAEEALQADEGVEESAVWAEGKEGERATVTFADGTVVTSSRTRPLEGAKAIVPSVHRRRGVTDEGDETADQTIVIQVMDYGGNGADEPPVIEEEATTVRVEGPA